MNATFFSKDNDVSSIVLSRNCALVWNDFGVAMIGAAVAALFGYYFLGGAPSGQTKRPPSLSASRPASQIFCFSSAVGSFNGRAMRKPTN